MPTMKKSDLVKLRTSYCFCVFPALTENAIHMRALHRDNAELRARMKVVNKKIAKTKKYSPEKYKKMQQLATNLSKPEIIAKRKNGRHIIRKNRKSTKLYDDTPCERPNDYAGVISMEDYQNL